MRKSIIAYLVILIILWFNAWDISFFASWFTPLNLPTLLLYMAGGYYYWHYEEDYLSINNLKPFIFILAGLFLSFIPAQLFYHQSILQSLITCRMQALWLCVPLLLRIMPTPKELMRTLEIVTFLMFCVFLIRHMFPNLFLFDEQTLERISKSDRGIDDVYISGFTIVPFLLYYKLNEFIEDTRFKALLVALFAFGYIVLEQNRSILFSCSLLVLFGLFKLQSRYKDLIWILLSIGIAIFIIFSYSMWSDLFLESSTDISDNDYNRNVALAYFIFGKQPHWICYFLGDGFISANVSSHMEDLRKLGIYNSDVGLIGYWNNFGILPVLAIAYMIVKPIINKKNEYPMYFVFMASTFLFCSLTIDYFCDASSMIVFALYYYLYIYYKEENVELRDDYLETDMLEEDEQ